ncbi:MAG: prepilin peptidase [Clostridia bacterium]|nr:type 4 prepilin-like proteins leader peptide-processing enzyme [Clostridium sp. CAG:389]
MEIFFYIIIFMIGITFGSFYTLAVYRIPKGQDIVHTHSYCPKCNHKLNIFDLIPIFSYIFLGGKCRYCKQKIRPRYLILEATSGFFFVVMAILMGLGIYNLDKFIIIEYVFFVLYFTFIVLMAGIDKEYRTINKPVLMYGVIISIMYIIYLYIIEKTSIYRYVIYLALFLILLLLDTIKLKKHAQNSYLYSILMVIIIMAIFTGEYITLNSIIITLIVIAFVLICKMTNKNKNVKTEKQYSKQLKIGLYLALSDIVCLMLSLALTYLMP